MIVIQTMPMRLLCKDFHLVLRPRARGGSGLQGRILQRGQNEATNNIDDAIGAGRNRCYTIKSAPEFPHFSHRRSFSKFSTDEIVIQENDAPTSTSSSSSSKCSSAGAPITPTTTSKSSSAAKIKSPMEISYGTSPSHPQKIQIAKDDDQLIVDVQRAHELFHQLFTESTAMLHNNTSATTSDELVAMTNQFMILLNSLDLEKYLEIVQSLQNNTEAGGGVNNNALEESLRIAAKSMSLLHHTLLKMVESSLPPLKSALLEIGTEEHSNTCPSPQLLHSAKTVRRALQLSRRAEELGLSLHRPMYQRLAMGIVLTSSPRSSSLEPLPPEHETNNDNDLHTPVEDSNITPPALTLQLMEILAHARSSFQIHTEGELVQLAEDILAEPVLLLLKAKHVEEVMSLLRAWQGIFGHASNDIDVISLLGESHTLKALEIVQGYTVDTKFMEAVQSDPHVMELTTLLEVALEEILKGRKKRVAKISEMLWQLSLRNEPDDDFDDKHDSDSEFEDEFEYDSDSSEEDDEDDDEFDTFTTPSARGLIPSGSLPATLATFDGDKVNVDEANGEEDDTEHFTILSGLSNKEARQSIYLRNGKDWALPDIVSQLEDWNKGNRLTFTPMFEQYIGNQIAKEAEEDDDDDDDEFY